MAVDRESFAATFESLRPQLLSYLTRMVVRVDVAEELVQSVAVRALQHLDAAPADPNGLRPWLFRIATNLALDERKRHGQWRESLMGDIKDFSKSDPSHQARLEARAAAPELRAIAREHLAFCLACTLARLPGDQAAILLLREMGEFERDQIARILDTDPIRVKNELQLARRATRDAYRDTCALLNKKGTCYQCAELDEAFGTGRGLDPLAGANDRLSARLKVVKEQPLGTWSRWLSDLLRALEEG